MRRMASTISAALRSLVTKPAAPAARAAVAEIRPAPETQQDAVAGWAARTRRAMSVPASSPTKRSTSATCGE